MKLHRLDLTGFGPFRDTQTVDFDAFDADGLFLISGRTGAGKSSILDGVSFALYGSVPRYDGGERRLRSDHCDDADPTWVRLEFTVGGRRLRVTRAPEYDRPAKRGSGLVTEPTSAELEELVGGSWIGIAAKPREVGIELSEVLGLSAVQFQQVILLAQNKFSRFLLATGDERQALLRTLFDTKRFATYEAELEERRKTAQRELDAAGERVGVLLEQVERLISDNHLDGSGIDDADRPPALDLARRRVLAEAAQQRADYRVDTAVDARARAEADAVAAASTHTEYVARAKSATELERLRERFTQLESGQSAIADDRRRVEAALAAEALRAPLDAATRERRTYAAAVADADEAARVWRSVAPDEAEQVAGAIDRLTGEVAVAGAALAQEKALVDDLAELARHTDALAHLDVETRANDDARAAIPAERAALETRLAAARAAAALADGARERLSAAETIVVAAAERDRLAPLLASAEAAYLAASARASDASQAVTRLLQRRLSGMAGEIAASLVDGEPCPVCGAAAHPHPAAPAGDPITDAHLAEAESERETAAGAEKAAADEARGLRELAAAAAAVAGDVTVAALRATRDAVAAEVDAAEAARRESDDLSASLAACDARAAALASTHDELTTLRTALVDALSAVRTRVEGARADVDRARGEAASVADRMSMLTELLETARAAHAAAERKAERTRARDAAIADLDRRIDQSPFSDAEAATAALVAPEERRALEERVSAYDVEIRATRERLLELELELSGRELPPGALDDAAEAARLADEARAAAIAGQRDAERTAGDLRDQLARVGAAFDTAATATEEAAVVIRFADTVAGRAPNTRRMDLETFVLAAELEEIVTAANLRLTEMSSGRYTLHHSDAKESRGRASGLGIDVLDAHTGRRRSPHSLSGGETFLASLALALGLAEVVTHRAGGLRLDTLFVDEGFGSLDPETLDLAMRTLDELRAGGRTVGLISHVEAMKDQVPAQLIVEAGVNGPSRIRQDVAADA
ncbi:AAA family ATPase [Microbacterium telephonicum]|uniref:Nuclease SbcCD subunit C n=1 Tax=Microbacterium telephonicum TaxID=1714841 RepID=A0A498CA45_9MICO|nr:SMC family ATPase [Microbacterium telephonicum]RLK52794.1 exonuclease SbcC [Microbacterium telephonicum]